MSLKSVSTLSLCCNWPFNAVADVIGDITTTILTIFSDGWHIWPLISKYLHLNFTIFFILSFLLHGVELNMSTLSWGNIKKYYYFSKFLNIVIFIWRSPLLMLTLLAEGPPCAYQLLILAENVHPIVVHPVINTFLIGWTWCMTGVTGG